MTLTCRSVSLLCLVTLLCCRFGQVNQGRVVAYDPEAGTVTLITASQTGAAAGEQYDRLPPLTVGVPHKPVEIGPAPQAGRLLRIDREKACLMVYSPETQSIESIPFRAIEATPNISPYDPQVREARLPQIDRENRTIALYSPADRLLMKISVAPHLLALPEDTWKAGDEVRYYYKDPAHALRLMNISRTDLSKGGQ